MIDHHSRMEPAERDAFGQWLSGLVDGEGCFMLRVFRQKGREYAEVRFAIALRQDDRPILDDVQKFWGVGLVRNRTRHGKIRMATYSIHRVHDLATVIVPHFDSYPLYAKKQHDYAIWREGVLLCRSVRCTGERPRWEPEQLRRFKTLCSRLKKQREFVDTEAIAARSPVLDPRQGSFDFCD